jgi:probable FeS assembly SUF system protein SufT
MQNVISVELKRDCEAIQIPSGTPITLRAGAPVDITQTLGGSYTVHTQAGLFRIASEDADALGIDLTRSDANASGKTGAAAGEGEVLDEQAVWDTLKTCYDPEIPVNIVDLGLVYDMQIEPVASGRSRVSVKMTLTAPGCGMGTVIAGDAQQKLLGLDGVGDASVEIVWDPPWHQSMISPQGRAQLGLD